MKVKNLQTAVNPIQRARLQHGYTQEELAAVAGVSKPLIMRIEQGLISNVAWPVLEALYPDSALAQSGALDAFDSWRADTRVKNIGYFVNRVEALGAGYSKDHGISWLAFRESIHQSQAGFCKLYCIHPQVMRNFEKPKLVYERTELSKYLKDVFSSAGTEIVNKLEEYMKLYVESRKAS